MAPARAPPATKRTADGTEAPPAVESINAFESMPKILDDGVYLNAAYATYVVQREGNQTQPEPAALWISKAASAEVAKAQEFLVSYHTGEAASKRRQVATAAQDTQPLREGVDPNGGNGVWAS